MVNKSVLKKNIPLVITLCVILIYIIIQMSPLVKRSTSNSPVITFDNKNITLSVKDDPLLLLDGITAYDEEDGDITNQIEIESQSSFTSNNTRTVHYIVFDSDDNVTRASRTVTYSDYTPPVFSLNDQLTGEKYSVNELMKKVSAYSSVDGNISSKVTVMNVSFLETGVLNVKLSVTDSTNTTSYLNTKYYLENDKEIDIQLKKYLVYKKVGETYSFRDNIKSIVERLNVDNSLKPYVNIKVPDMSEPGIYEVEYTIKRSNGNTGKTIMIVVVE